MSSGFAAGDYFDLAGFEHAGIFHEGEPAWDALRGLGPYLERALVAEVRGRLVGAPYIGERVSIGEGTVVEPGAVILGPAVIGRDCTVRSGCYVRDNVLVGDGVFMGNSSEFKHCVLLNGAEVPHFNYVGDSILGNRTHLGAGVILANFRLDRDLGGISVAVDGGVVETGLDKFGAIIGDRTDIGANSVIGPGSAIGRDCRLYPGTHWRGGVLPHRRIVKVRQTLEIVERRDGR